MCPAAQVTKYIDILGPAPLMYKAKAHSRYGRDIVGSERWQQQSHVLFQRLGSSDDTMCIT